MKNKGLITNSCFQSLALLAFVSALMAHVIEKSSSVEEALAKRTKVVSCGSLLTTTLSIQSEFSTLRNYREVQIISNHRTGYGDKGDPNSCPHQLTQSNLWISNERKYKVNSCGRQYHA